MGSFDRGDVSAAGTPSQAQTVYAGESYFAEHAGNVSASQQPQQQAHDDLDELAEESEDEEARLSGRGEQREQVREESSSLPAPRQQPAAGTDALSHDEPRGSGHANNEHEDGDGTMSMEMTRPYHSSSPSKSLAAMGNSSTHASDSQKENASSAPAPSAEHKRKGKGKQVQQEALAAPSSSFDEVSLIPAKSAARAAQQQHKHRSQPPPQASGNTSIIEHTPREQSRPPGPRGGGRTALHLLPQAQHQVAGSSKSGLTRSMTATDAGKQPFIYRGAATIKKSPRPKKRVQDDFAIADESVEDKPEYTESDCDEVVEKDTHEESGETIGSIDESAVRSTVPGPSPSLPAPSPSAPVPTASEPVPAASDASQPSPSLLARQHSPAYADSSSPVQGTRDTDAESTDLSLVQIGALKSSLEQSQITIEPTQMVTQGHHSILAGDSQQQQASSSIGKRAARAHKHDNDDDDEETDKASSYMPSSSQPNAVAGQQKTHRFTYKLAPTDGTTRSYQESAVSPNRRLRRAVPQEAPRARDFGQQQQPSSSLPAPGFSRSNDPRSSNSVPAVNELSQPPTQPRAKDSTRAPHCQAKASAPLPALELIPDSEGAAPSQALNNTEMREEEVEEEPPTEDAGDEHGDAESEHEQGAAPNTTHDEDMSDSLAVQEASVDLGPLSQLTAQSSSSQANDEAPAATPTPAPVPDKSNKRKCKGKGKGRVAELTQESAPKSGPEDSMVVETPQADGEIETEEPKNKQRRSSSSKSSSKQKKSKSKKPLSLRESQSQPQARAETPAAPEAGPSNAQPAAQSSTSVQTALAVQGPSRRGSRKGKEPAPPTPSPDSLLLADNQHDAPMNLDDSVMHSKSKSPRQYKSKGKRTIRDDDEDEDTERAEPAPQPKRSRSRRSTDAGPSTSVAGPSKSKRNRSTSAAKAAVESEQEDKRPPRKTSRKNSTKRARTGTDDGEESDASASDDDKPRKSRKKGPVKRARSERKASIMSSNAGEAGIPKGFEPLSDDAAFSRVFAIWPKDKAFYPGTITAVSPNVAQVAFDDGHVKPVPWRDVRKAQLEEGDLVRYRGDGASKKGVDQCVYRCEHELTGDDNWGELLSKDIVVAVEQGLAKSARAGAEKDRYEVAALVFSQHLTSQFDDRIITASDLAQLGVAGVEVQTDKPLESYGFLVTMPQLPASSPVKGKGKVDGSKEALVAAISELGGVVLNIDDLVKVTTERRDSLIVEFPEGDVRSLRKIVCVAEAPVQSLKWMVSLALRLPLVHSSFVHACKAESRELHLDQWLLASGFSHVLNSWVVGPQACRTAKDTHALEEIEDVHSKGAGLFAKRSFMVVHPEDFASEQRAQNRSNLLAMLGAGGASEVAFRAGGDSLATAREYDFLVHDDAPRRKDAREHAGLVNKNWIKQCLINGRVLPPARLDDD